jgi:hypothetical protein
MIMRREKTGIDLRESARIASDEAWDSMDGISSQKQEPLLNTDLETP